VAGTDSAPVSCASVDIDLSTDGGQNFDVVVEAGTPNDGSELITVPSEFTSEARLRVRCSDSIFFDINDADFTIDDGSNDFSIALSPATQEACVGETGAIDVAVGQIGSFNDAVDLSASGYPGATAFTQNGEPPPFDAELRLFSLPAGDFTVTVTGTAASGTRQDSADVSVIDSPSAAPGLTSPADGALLDNSTPQLQWSAVLGATEYLVEIDDQSDFATPELSQVVAGTTFEVPGGLLQSGTAYFWRVTAQNSCGQQTSESRQFTAGPVPIIFQDRFEQ
jgi:hypothetical protein